MDTEEIRINIYTPIIAMLNQVNLLWCVNYNAEQSQQSVDSFAQLRSVLKRFPTLSLLSPAPLLVSLPFCCLSPHCLSVFRFLELKMQEMESRHREELEVLREEKSNLQALVIRQSGVILELEAQLGKASGNSTVLQKQQQDLMDTVHSLLNLCSKDGGTEKLHRSALTFFPRMLR